MARLMPRRLAPDEQATLVEHLGELRHRVFIVLLALVPALAVAYAFHSTLIGWLTDLLPEGVPLVTLGVTEPFTTSLKVSFYAALAICLPILLWQIWAFFAPAVDRDTQRILSIFVVLATGLFICGVLFSYFVVLPKALDFLVGYDSELYEEQIRASYFLSFVAVMLLASGVAFLMPIFILALVRIGVLSSATLRRNRRLGIVGMIAFAILLPTVDPVSLALEVAPLIILFEASIWLSAFMERRWNRGQEPDDTGDGTEAPPPDDAPEPGAPEDPEAHAWPDDDPEPEAFDDEPAIADDDTQPDAAEPADPAETAAAPEAEAPEHDDGVPEDATDGPEPEARGS